MLSAEWVFAGVIHSHVGEVMHANMNGMYLFDMRQHTMNPEYVFNIM